MTFLFIHACLQPNGRRTQRFGRLPHNSSNIWSAHAMANISICHRGKPLLDLLRLKNVLTMTIYVECGPKPSLISLWPTILRRPLTWLLMWRPNLAMPLTSTRQVWGANRGDVKSRHEFQIFWGPKCGTSPTILRSNSWQLGNASQMRATLYPKVPN